MTSFAIIVIGYVVTDFELGFGLSGEAPAIEWFGLEAASKRFGVGVVIAVAAPAHALQCAMFGDQDFEAGRRAGCSGRSARPVQPRVGAPPRHGTRPH